jgi:uncharacterized protein
LEFKRTIEPKLLNWKDSKNRKPLLLNGARQVGKTSLLKAFGKRHFKRIAYFNFDEQPELHQFFEQTKDPERLLSSLSLVFGSTINHQTDLLVFDEIQECKAALNSLKYFYEKTPEYAIAGAGSLLGITLNNQASFPVGKVEFMEVYPLTFFEFLQGADAALADYAKAVAFNQTVPDIFFNQLLDKFKQYFISGGMPEPAKRLVVNKEVEETQQVLSDILKAYELDFSKHVQSKDISKVQLIWQSIPSQLAKENNKFLYQAVKPGARAREYEDALKWLEQAGLIYKVYNCKKPNVPLSAYDDLSAFKIFMLDVGLLRRKSQLHPSAYSEGNRLFTEFKGALTENFVLQSLLPQSEALPRYWTSPGRAEVDFLIQFQNEIIPIEVKSSESVKSRSLARYADEYNPKLRLRYSLKNLEHQKGFLNIPLFLIDRTTDFIKAVIHD